eukprot:667421-Alexandrium_andersonii.AAC.1
MRELRDKCDADGLIRPDWTLSTWPGLDWEGNEARTQVVRWHMAVFLSSEPPDLLERAKKILQNNEELHKLGN